MSKLSLIIKREYYSRVNKKSFIVMTLLTPLIMVGIIFLPLWLSTLKDDQIKKVTVIDYTGIYDKLLTNTDTYHFEAIKPSGETPQQLHKKDGNANYAIVVIKENLLNNPNAITIYSEKQVNIELKNYIANALQTYLQDQKLSSYNIPNLKNVIEESKVKLDITTIKWSDDGQENKSSTEIATMIGMFSAILIYMFVFMYGAQVMNGVTEEKTNRIVEVLISSVKPFDLMMGKIVAVGMVGLTQFLIWIALIGGIMASTSLFFGLSGGDAITNRSMILSLQGNELAMMNEVTSMMSSFNIAQIILLFVVYFIGGFLLYASLFAAIGSAVDNQADTQQFVMPVTLIILFALYAGIYSAQNPDGPLAMWCSFIPFTSPIVMMVRLPFGVPAWQLILSVAILYTSFIFSTYISARIYRIGILMYGKKPSYKELIKWISYKG